MSELAWPLPCIICAYKPDPAFPGDARQPYKATIFSSRGQYGSTVFDEMGRRFLEINICDRCLREKAAEGVIALGVRIPRPNDFEYEPWRPYDSEDEESEE